MAVGKEIRTQIGSIRNTQKIISDFRGNFCISSVEEKKNFLSFASTKLTKLSRRKRE